jgi:6-phosphogluconolactonase
VCSDSEAVAREGARRFALHAAAAIQQHGRLAVALSGGSTPKRMYELLALEPYRDRIDWNFVHFFWGDERFVPFTNPASNYHMTEVALLNALGLQNGNVHRVHTELESAEAAALAYEREIVSFFSPPPGQVPKFDLVLLGLGTNGHTLSLFPHSKSLSENSRVVVAEYIEEVKQSRITLTAPVANAARDVLFVVTGAEKASVVREVLFGPQDPERLPAQLIHTSPGTTTWLLDSAAAAQLPQGSFRMLP